MIKDIIIVVLIGILVSIYLYEIPEQQGRWYDCGMADWHPDFPKDVKEECRKRAIEHWKKKHDKSTV